MMDGAELNKYFIDICKSAYSRSACHKFVKSQEIILIFVTQHFTFCSGGSKTYYPVIETSTCNKIKDNYCRQQYRSPNTV